MLIGQSSGTADELSLREPGVLICCSSWSGKLSVARVLIAEDDVKMAAAIHRGVEVDGIAADVVSSGELALVRASATDYDLIVLDVMLGAQVVGVVAPNDGRSVVFS
jgi:PleD family two-component response regulator